MQRGPSSRSQATESYWKLTTTPVTGKQIRRSPSLSYSEEGKKAGTRIYSLFLKEAERKASPVTQVVVKNFNKMQGLPNTCWTAERMKSGNRLGCPIDLDAEGVPANQYIRDMEGSCSPASAICDHTLQCPGGGICDKHLERSAPDPNQLRNGKYRKATWYGWTNDVNNATLTIRAEVGP